MRNNTPQLIHFHLQGSEVETAQHRAHVSTFLGENFPNISGEHPDLHWINPENEALSIDDVRTLTQDAALQPYQSPDSIFVMFSIDRASLPAQHALLKLLEEPPPHVQFVLTTTNLDRVLQTIQSRCSVLRVETTEEDQESNPEMAGVFETIQTGTYSQLFALSEMYKEKAGALTLLETVLRFYHTQNQAQPAPNLLRNIQTLTKGIAMLEQNVNVRLALEECFLRIREH